MFKYLFFGLVIIILFFPLQVFAQERGFLGGPIVPCGIKSDPQRSHNCTLCDIFVLTKNVINFLFELILVIAPVFVLIGGGIILLSAGAPEKINLGKKVMLSTVIGIVIALVSWTALNMLFNNFIDPSVAPWPWNNPNCEGGGIIESGFCHLQYSDSPDVMFRDYETSQMCRQECPNQCTGNCETWCCLGEDMGGQEDVCVQAPPAQGEYCVCLTPRYNDTNPELAEQIYTDIRVTNLNTTEDCESQCRATNFRNYCSSPEMDLPLSKYEFGCVSATTANSIQACSVSLGEASAGSGCRVGTTCYNSDRYCSEAALTTYRNICYLDDVSLCDSYQLGFSTFCLTGSQKALCNSDPTKYVLWQWRDEQAHTSLQGAYDCSRVSYGNTGRYCRLNCQYYRCTSPEYNWCQRPAPLGSDQWILNPPPDGAEEGQKGDASSTLTSFLNCMYSRIPNLRINSISNNILCSNPTCDISTPNCGHEAFSCHFGGLYCSGWSYAVDFDDQPVPCSQIEQAAMQCDQNAWFYWEDDHVHITVRGAACGCNRYQQSCP